MKAPLFPVTYPHKLGTFQLGSEPVIAYITNKPGEGHFFVSSDGQLAEIHFGITADELHPNWGIAHHEACEFMMFQMGCALVPALNGSIDSSAATYLLNHGQLDRLSRAVHIFVTEAIIAWSKRSH
jgi:hypothetical protein